MKKHSDVKVYIKVINGGSGRFSGIFPVTGPLKFTTDEDGNLYLTYNEDLAVSFTVDDDGNLYVESNERGISFELDDNGNLYMLEE